MENTQQNPDNERINTIHSGPMGAPLLLSHAWPFPWRGSKYRDHRSSRVLHVPRLYLGVRPVLLIYPNRFLALCGDLPRGFGLFTAVFALSPATICLIRSPLNPMLSDKHTHSLFPFSEVLAGQHLTGRSWDPQKSTRKSYTFAAEFHLQS